MWALEADQGKDQVGVVDRCLQGRPLQPAEGGAQAGPQRGSGVCEDLHGGAWVAGPQGPEGSGLFPAPGCVWSATEAGCSFTAYAKQASPKSLKVTPLSPFKAIRCVSLGICLAGVGWRAVHAVKSACGLSVRGQGEPCAGSQSVSHSRPQARPPPGGRGTGVCVQDACWGGGGSLQPGTAPWRGLCCTVLSSGAGRDCRVMQRGRAGTFPVPGQS